MPRFPRLPTALAIVSCGLGASIAVAAPVTAFDPTGLAGGSNGYILNGVVSNYTLGFRFTTSEALHVTELGMRAGSGRLNTQRPGVSGLAAV